MIVMKLSNKDFINKMKNVTKQPQDSLLIFSILT